MDQIKGNAADYIAKACPKAAGEKIGNGAKGAEEQPIAARQNCKG